jgi:hypothetical protein
MARTAFYSLLGILAFLLGSELVLRALPVSTATRTGYHIDPLILTYPPQHRWTTATGWDLRNAQSHRANNYGFLAERDFVPDERAVALIGDSFVEASMLDPADRLGPQLERRLGRPVYAMGGPGSALLDYAERIRFAHEKFGIRDFVIFMERGDVRQSLCGSGNIHGPCLDRQTLAPRTETQAPAGLAKRVLRESALAQYLFSQLKLNPQRLWDQIVTQSRPVTPETAGRKDAAASGVAPASEQAVAAVTRAFLVRAKPHAARLVVVIDQGRGKLNEGVIQADPEISPFMSHLRAGGANVLDAGPLYRTHAASSLLKLEVGPYDGHLNRLGLALIASAVSATLGAAEPPPGDTPSKR